MPRGRHRHSPPLHRLLPPSTVAGAALVSAAGAWLFAEPMVLRGLAGAAAAAAVVGAYVMRRWDRVAGKRVAELTRGQASAEWRHEERTAELEADLEESRELRGKLEAKLRAKRAELAALRNEHAELLRRYATAETERASALEGRRQLAIEAASPARALPPGGGSGKPEGRVNGTAQRVLSPALYVRANTALDQLARSGRPEPEEAEAPQGKPEAADAHERTVAVPPARHYPVPAAAVVPHAPVRRTAMGGFDFFGTKPAIENEDLADVVGTEALALHRAETEPDTEPDHEHSTPSETRAVGQVIDLTAHDDTEQLDLGELRSAFS